MIDDFSVEKPDIESNLRALLFEREAEVERLTADRDAWKLTAKTIKAEADELHAGIARLRAVVTRAKDALLDGQSTQWVHDLLVTALVARRVLEDK